MTYKKCSSTTFCKALSDRLGSNINRTAKGLFRIDFTDLDTGEDAGTLVSYSKGKGDKGLLLNFCPWCGYSFHDSYHSGRLSIQKEDVKLPKVTLNPTNEG